MKKNLRTVKTTIIFGLLLVSLFAVFTCSTSARLLKIDPLVEVKHSVNLDPVNPNTEAIYIELETSLSLYGIGASSLKTNSLLKDEEIQVELTVEHAPDWCSAIITNNVLGISPTDTTSKQSLLMITVTENAPAFAAGEVEINAHVFERNGILFMIKDRTFQFSIPFQVGFLPVIMIETPKGTLMEIGPMDTADFEIDIQNIGNGATRVECKLLNQPDDWSLSIPSSITLPSPLSISEPAEGDIHFRIKPPYGFGYHNDVQTFTIKLTPYYIGRADLVGQEEEILFTIQSRGFSTPGFELPLIAAGLIGIVLIYKVKKKKQ